MAPWRILLPLPLLLLTGLTAPARAEDEPAEASPDATEDRTDFAAWFEGRLASPRAEALLAEVDAAVERLEGELAGLGQDPRDRAAIQRSLALLVDEDRTVREALLLAVEAAFLPPELNWLADELGDRAQALDQRTTRRLRALLQVHDWFTLSGFGPEADKQGLWLLARAGSDPELQQTVLARLERLAFRGETSISHYAALHDAVSVAAGRPQRFGTQGRCAGPGAWELLPLEEPAAEVDARRARVMLGPLAEVQALLSAACP